MTLAFDVVDGCTQPVIAADRTAAGPLGFGFEGGRVVRLDSTLHLLTTELIAEPLWSKTIFALWTSNDDGATWVRERTILESSGDFTGLDNRAAYFSPMAVFDETTDRWQLFYVSYRSAEGIALRNHDGIIWRAQSTEPGMAGIAGPYLDQDVVLRPGSESQPWEGLQGTDSFFPFFNGSQWVGLYGSCDVENYPDSNWLVGVATADSLTGEWKRAAEGNPLQAEPHFIENPVVTTISDGTFIAVDENDALDPAFARSLGVMTSRDGLAWTREPPMIIPDSVCAWAARVRTPLCLLDEDGDFVVFFTAFDERGSLPGSTSYGNVGALRVRLRS